MSTTTLSTFAENGLKAIYEATSEKALDSAFDAFFAKNVEFIVNGKKTTHDQYKARLWNEKRNERTATVNFAGAVEVPSDDKHPRDVSLVRS